MRSLLRKMSFSTKLTSFFVIMVIIPTFLSMLLLLISSSQIANKKTSAKAEQSLQIIGRLYTVIYSDSVESVEKMTSKKSFKKAWRSGNKTLLEYLKKEQSEGLFVSARAFNSNRDRQWRIGGKSNGLSMITVENKAVALDDSNNIKTLEISAVSPEFSLIRSSQLTNHLSVMTEGDKIIASTWDPNMNIRENKKLFYQNEVVNPKNISYDMLQNDFVKINDKKLFIASMNIPSLEKKNKKLYILVAPEKEFSNIGLTLIFISMSLLVLYILYLIKNSLQQQLEEILSGTRLLKSGNYKQRLSVSGNDEMSQLANEFNELAVRLEDRQSLVEKQLNEIDQQKHQLERTLYSFGRVAASSLSKKDVLSSFIDAVINNSGVEKISLIELKTHSHKRARDLEWSSVTNTNTGNNMLFLIEKPAGIPSHLSFREKDVNLYLSREISHKKNTLIIDDASSLVAKNHILMSSLIDSYLVLIEVKKEYEDEIKKLLNYLIQQMSISIENIEMHEKFSEQSKTDGLTKLYNRHYLNEAARDKVREASEEKPLSILILDIDDFKAINDTWGHGMGDQAIKYVSRRMTEVSREADMVFRYGGEEFIILLPDTDNKNAEVIANRLLLSIETTIDHQGVQTDIVLDSSSDVTTIKKNLSNNKLPLTVSIGGATLKESAEDIDLTLKNIIKTADENLYKAKDKGKNAYCC